MVMYDEDTLNPLDKMYLNHKREMLRRKQPEFCTEKDGAGLCVERLDQTWLAHGMQGSRTGSS